MQRNQPLSLVHEVESVVDLVQPHGVGDELVHLPGGQRGDMYCDILVIKSERCDNS